ncbi:type IV pilus biogenesis/stability protein PilW [Alteromonas facilis]|uniref:type IV pilus biogenesis/stability protein PilW n=1 Tax=Alteromonas facilis TaxID=2048004 RepID=UPI0013DC3115|nr:type IV pilus biogenesis/stability protein PilW [Alteromonas facilis]
MFARLFALLLLLALAGCVSEPLPEGFERTNDFDQVEAAKTRISLGLTYLKNGNYTQAKLNLDKALEFAPRLADAHYSLAYYYQLVEEFARAEQSYENAMDLDPRNPDIANSYGAFLCQQGRYDQAKTFFLKAVNSQSYANSAETYENIALCSLSQDRPNEAIDYLQTALKHQPTRAKSLFLLTELQVREEQFALAKQTLARYQRVARVSAETLWMSVQIAQGLGQMDEAKGFGDMMMRMYPRHGLTQRYVASMDKPLVTPKVAQTPKPVAAPVEPIQPEPEQVKSDVDTAPSINEEDKALTEARETAEVAKAESAAETVVDSVTDTMAEVSEETAANTEAETVVEATVETTVKPDSDEIPVADASSDVATVTDETDVDDSISATNDYPVEDVVEENGAVDQAETSTEQSLQDSDTLSNAEAASTVSSSTAMDSELDTEDKVVQKHTVAAGENLYRISLRYNIKMSSLIEWNQLPENGSIQKGMTLWVVDPESVTQE